MHIHLFLGLQFYRIYKLDIDRILYSSHPLCELTLWHLINGIKWHL
jgi:hypothetical protein